MSDLYSQLQTLLTDVIIPKLKGIHSSQVEQRFQTEVLSQDLEDFRAEMQIQFAELRAELTDCRQQLEDAMVTIRESEAANGPEPGFTVKKTMIH